MLSSIPFYIGLLKAPLEGGGKATNSHVLVYGAVTVHAMGQKGCIASNNKIATETGYSKQRVADVLSDMSRSGWVRVDMKDGKRIRITPLLEIAKVNEEGLVSRLRGVSVETKGGLVSRLRGVSVETNIYNNIDNTTTWSSQQAGSAADDKKSVPNDSDSAGDSFGEAAGSLESANTQDPAVVNDTSDDEPTAQKLFYDVVKSYTLTVRNHKHVEGQVKRLVATHGDDVARYYLKRLIEIGPEKIQELGDSMGYVVRLSEMLDIYAKSTKMMNFLADAKKKGLL